MIKGILTGWLMRYGQKELPFEDIETLDDPPKKKEVKLSKFNKSLKTGLNYNPKKE